MKTILTLLILFSTITLPALGELTDPDLDKIRLILQEEISKEIKPLRADIDRLKTDGAIRQTEITNLKETINNRFNNVQKDFDNVQKDFDNVQKNFDNIQKNFDRQNNIIIACIGIPLGILAIGVTVWGISANRRSRKDQTLEKQIETLTQEIEILKQQRIVSS